MARSTNYDSTYQRARFMRSYLVDLDRQDADDIVPIVKLDTLDQRYVDIIRYIKNYSLNMYGGEKITTLSFQFYGNSSLWWLLLMFNGLYSPLELTDGMIYKAPAKADVDAYIASLIQPIRKIITI